MSAARLRATLTADVSTDWVPLTVSASLAFTAMVSNALSWQVSDHASPVLVTARGQQEEVESNIIAVCWLWGFSYVAWFRLERLNWINLMEVWQSSQWLDALLKWYYLQDRRFVQRPSVNSTETVCKVAWNRAATHLWVRSSPSVTVTAATGASRWVMVQSLDLPEDLSLVTGHWEVLLFVFQCHGSTGHCWCVDSRGQERAGTRTPPGTAPSDCDRQGDI